MVAYNACAGGNGGVTFENAEPNTKKFHFAVQPGWYHTRLLLQFTDDRENYVGMGARTVFRPALDLEFLLPSGNDKYALVLRPSYYKYASTGTKLVRDRDVTVTVDYSAIDVPLGFRYYSFINPNLKAFGTASLGFVFLSGGEVRQQPQQPRSLRTLLASSNTSGARFLLSYTLY